MIIASGASIKSNSKIAPPSARMNNRNGKCQISMALCKLADHIDYSVKLDPP